MKTIEFTYTKANGDVSHRALAVLSEPSKMYEGLDLSELSIEDFIAFSKELRALKDKQLEEFNTLAAKYELQNQYRRFIPERMTHIEPVLV